MQAIVKHNWASLVLESEPNEFEKLIQIISYDRPKKCYLPSLYLESFLVINEDNSLERLFFETKHRLIITKNGETQISAWDNMSSDESLILIKDKTLGTLILTPVYNDCKVLVLRQLDSDNYYPMIYPSEARLFQNSFSTLVRYLDGVAAEQGGRTNHGVTLDLSVERIWGRPVNKIFFNFNIKTENLQGYVVDLYSSSYHQGQGQSFEITRQTEDISNIMFDFDVNMISTKKQRFEFEFELSARSKMEKLETTKTFTYYIKKSIFGDELQIFSEDGLRLQ